MDFTKLIYLLTKDINTLVFTLASAAIILLYFKYVKYPQDTILEDVKELSDDLKKVKTDVDSLESCFDAANQTRIAEAARNEQTLEKIEDLRTKVSKLEEKVNDIRVELASITRRK